MSIFSRLFNKGQDPEAKPADQAEAGEVGPQTAQDPSQPHRGSAPSEEELLGSFDGSDAEDDPTKQQERPDLVFETGVVAESKKERTKEAAVKEPAKPPSEARDTSTLVRQAAGPASVGAPSRTTGSGKGPPAPVARDLRPTARGVPLPPPPPPKKETVAQRTDKPVPAPTAAPATSPKGGRPVADLGKLFSGSEVDTTERARVEEVDTPSAGTPPRTETSDIRNLFTDMAGNYVLPVRDFMFDVKSGEARVDWLHTCESSVRSLHAAAESLTMTKLAHALERFGEVLKAVDPAQQTIGGDTRDKLLAAYFNLIDLMPQAFGLDAERLRRETIIINSLLLQIPGVQRGTVERMNAAGLSSLETIVGAKSDEIASATGLSMEIATKIVDKLQAHRKELEAGSLAGLPPTPAPEGLGAPPMPGTRGHHATSTDSQEVPTDNASIEVLIDDAPSEPPPAPAPTVKLLPPSADRDRIEQLLAELRAHHLAYASVAEGWTEAATSRRRELRKLRTDALKQVKVVLIRLGEVEGVSEIEKLSFEHKLERIERYLRA